MDFIDKNAVKFRCELNKTYTGPLEEIVRIVFGENFDDNLFVDFCKKNDIEYSKFIWISGC